MDLDVTLVVTRPLCGVFAFLGDPARLSAWLMPQTPSYDGGSGGQAPSASLEEAFVVPLGDEEGVGEVIGHEPPRYVAYRVTVRGATHVLRITCAAGAEGTTRVHVHQSGVERLAIDLPALDCLLHEGVGGS